jgi:hypothetical protein
MRLTNGTALAPKFRGIFLRAKRRPTRNPTFEFELCFFLLAPLGHAGKSAARDSRSLAMPRKRGARRRPSPHEIRRLNTNFVFRDTGHLFSEHKFELFLVSAGRDAEGWAVSRRAS